MKSECIRVPEIVVPAPEVDLPAWAVIACDQHTSDAAYWKKVDEFVGDKPSTLRLTLPEIYLQSDNSERIGAIAVAMQKYCEEGVFRKLPKGFVLVERKTPYSPMRYGIVLSVDLEAYSYEKKSSALIRATEATILERIPPRLKIRESASLEFPHVMLLYDDPQDTVLGPLKSDPLLEILYDFELNMGGGHITGKFIPGGEKVVEAFDRLIRDGLLFMVGDGNHSLATAKANWDKVKDGLSAAERENHPARFALCEAVNLYDEGLSFEAIHRFVKKTDVRQFIERLPQGGEGHGALYVAGKKVPIAVAKDAPLAVADIDAYIAEHIAKYGGEVDYIHGEDALCELTQKYPDSVGIALPKMDKSELFVQVKKHGSLPRKTFSMGESEEKRYYIEGKEIK